MSTDALLLHDLGNELSILSMLIKKLGVKNETMDKISNVITSMSEKISRGYKKNETPKTMVNINDYVSNLALCYPNVKFENNIKEPLKMMANGSQLNDALINVIKNSVEAGADTIKFEIRFNSLIIKDNGVCSRGVVERLNNNNIFTTKSDGAGLGTQGIRKFFEGIGCNVLYFLAPNPDPIRKTHGLVTRIKLP